MEQNRYLVGFVGCGNMGGVLLASAVKNVGGKAAAVCETRPEKAAAFIEKGVTLLPLEDLSRCCDFIFLAVKPQVLPAVLADMKEALSENPSAVLITMAAGVAIEKISMLTDKARHIIRIMPNLPASVGEGVILFALGEGVTEKEKEFFLSLLGGVGLLDELNEEDIDAGSVVSGCGPAFVYRFAEAFMKAAESVGVDKEKALLYVKQTILGAAAVMANTDTPLPDLVSAVCSPKGTTIEGIDTLNEKDIDGLLKATLSASYRRTLELKKG